ncbi:MAG: antitoxin [Protaetiibacter sp.]
MRTTLDLDDRVLAAARALARDESISLGAAVSRLAARGLEAGPRIVFNRSGFPILETRGGPPITLELVKQYRDDY